MTAVVDPLLDIRRGRAALRRRRTRTAAGVTTTIMAVGAVVAAVPSLQQRGGTEDAPVQTADGPSGTMAPAATTTPAATTPPILNEFCAPVQLTAQNIGKRANAAGELWRDPVIAPALASYRQAAVAILDPAGKHLENKITNVQLGGCDKSGLYGLGTELGWRSGDALGDVRVEVARSRVPKHEMEVVMDHEGWTTADLQLPAGVIKVEVADYDGGHAVFAKRDDGLTVAVDAEGVWGNNMPPGSPPARDLPGIDDLVELAASPLLTLPKV
jgi:hypothetical protein